MIGPATARILKAAAGVASTPQIEAGLADTAEHAATIHDHHRAQTG